MIKNRKVALSIISIAIFVATLLVANLTTFAQATTVQYVYDENGRLRAVISPNGETTVYTYDASGNIVSVTRQATALVTIAGFNPTSGVAGTSVTVFGSGFSSNPIENVVNFNGTPATVTASSSTQITTSVPTGATTGPITVVSPNGSAISRVNFLVRAALEITDFDPTVGTRDTPVLITGNGFDSTAVNNVVKFNGFPAAVDTSSSTEIPTTVPAGATSGHISVTNSSGTAVSAGDFFVPPFPYTAESVDFTGRLTFGQSKTFTLTSFGRIALIVFDGAAGQKVRVATGNVTLGFGLLTLFQPDGSFLTQRFISPTSGTFITELPATGTYTILIEPFGSGSVTLSLTQITDFVSTITADGPPVTVSVGQPGQSVRVTFTGTAGQRVSLSIVDVTFPSAEVALLQPDGTILSSTFVSSSGSGGGGQPTLLGGGDPPGTGFIDAVTLPASGTYTIAINPFGTLGSATLRLFNVADQTNTITVNGPTLPLTVATPGQNVQISFAGTEGQLLDLNLSGMTIPRVKVSVFSPEGLYVAPTEVTGSGGDVGIPNLPSTGTYLIVFDPQSFGTGDVVLSLITVQDVSGNMTVGGPPITITTLVGGQNARATFNGEADQRVLITLSDVSIFGSFISITDPNGTVLVDSVFVSTNGMVFDISNLPATGTYTIFIDPLNNETGSMTLQATTTTTLTINGPPVTAVITTPGLTPTYTFEGVSGGTLRVTQVTNNIPSGTFSVFQPDGTLLITDTLDGIPSFVLPDTGTYTLKIDPEGNTGLIQFRIRNGGGGSGD